MLQFVFTLPVYRHVLLDNKNMALIIYCRLCILNTSYTVFIMESFMHFMQTTNEFIDIM